jgi:hypothetical protein
MAELPGVSAGLLVRLQGAPTDKAVTATRAPGDGARRAADRLLRRFELRHGAKASASGEPEERAQRAAGHNAGPKAPRGDVPGVSSAMIFKLYN